MSTAHLDVACYPPHVLQLPWRKVVDAARARGRSLDLDDLPEPFSSTFNKQALEYAQRPKTPVVLEEPAATSRKRGGEKKSPVRAPPSEPPDPQRVRAAFAAKASSFDEGSFLKAIGAPAAEAPEAKPALPAIPPPPPAPTPPSRPSPPRGRRPSRRPPRSRREGQRTSPAETARSPPKAEDAPKPKARRRSSSGGSDKKAPPKKARRASEDKKPELASAPASAPYRSKGKDRPKTTPEEKPRFAIGDLVEVAPRTHPGVNFPGGAATIREIHDERLVDQGPMRDGSEKRTTGFTYAVKYVLGGSEKRVDAQHISKSVDNGGRRSSSPRASEESALPPKKRTVRRETEQGTT